MFRNRTNQQALVKRLIEHLIQNEVKSIQVTCNQAEQQVNCTLTPYLLTKYDTGIQQSFTGLQSGNDDEFADVTIVYLRPCEGKMQHDMLFDLVCEAHRCSTKGVIVLGPKSLTTKTKSDKWGTFLAQVGILNGNPELLDDGWQACAGNNCGHPCPFVCHLQDEDHNSSFFKCQYDCAFVCANNHPCQKLCSEECDSYCDVSIMDIPGCNHQGPLRISCDMVRLLPNICFLLIPLK